jgi:hypothetical protein
MSTTISNTSNDVLYARNSQNTITTSTTLTEADAGKTYNIATDALVITLPLIEEDSIGMEFTFRNTGADGANIITLSPASADGIRGTIANSAADSVASGVVNKDLINTKATANNGDWVKLRAVSTTKWFIEGGVGIWASQG